MEKLEEMWAVKTTVVSVVIGALGDVTPKLSGWFQQKSGAASEISAQKKGNTGNS